ncbi:MAG: hypothetical protein JJE39_05700 [Vicinamibacteria bacterium]|nr:hypothetical protein [Vicinamibacteria bacterium]
MRFRDLASRGRFVLFAVAGLLLVLSKGASVRAAAPIVTISAAGVKIQIASAPLSETIDALSQAAGFKVTYEGSRPTARLFNAEIDTPTVAETLFRLLEGQNLNYAVVFDLSGRKVTSLMLLGPASRSGGTTGASSSAPPRPFTPPAIRRSDPAPPEDDPAEGEDAQPEPPTPPPAPSASPLPPGPQGPGGAPVIPLPPSPFAPRPLVVSPFAPRATPSPSP